jgi:hypothetical protein
LCWISRNKKAALEIQRGFIVLSKASVAGLKLMINLSYAKQPLALAAVNWVLLLS